MWKPVSGTKRTYQLRSVLVILSTALLYHPSTELCELLDSHMLNEQGPVLSKIGQTMTTVVDGHGKNTMDLTDPD